jgi:hypothetical protein
MNPGMGKDKLFIIKNELVDEILVSNPSSASASSRTCLAGLKDGTHLPQIPQFSSRQPAHLHRSNSLIYRVCSAVLAVVYFGGVIILEGFLRKGIGLFGQSQAAIFISTLCAAALFSPLRRFVQKTIDRRFFRRSYNTELTLQAFSDAVHNEVDLDKLSIYLVNLVEETIQPSGVSLWLNEPKS